jgi:hypothetical protein
MSISQEFRITVAKDPHDQLVSEGVSSLTVNYEGQEISIDL